MTKDAIVIARIESELKTKAQAQRLNISEAIEIALKDKIKDNDKITLILQVEKYGISLVPNNWVVGRISEPSQSQAEGNRKDFFDANTQTYHATLHQALIELSKRLLEDKLKTACKDSPLELKELAKLINEHHAYFLNLVKGM